MSESLFDEIRFLRLSRNHSSKILQCIIWFITFVGLFGEYGLVEEVVAGNTECKQLGWFPESFGLKDHSVFWHGGYYYLIANYIPFEDRFAYGRSTDLCVWEALAPVLSERVPGSPDEMDVWAPFVYKEGKVYYLFYTGVTEDFTQSIMLATTTNPEDPESWRSQGVIFQPNHKDMIWQEGNWADCRDPNVVKVRNTYYLHYTGQDEAGGIVGLATATSPFGEWSDWGAVTPAVSGEMQESPALAQFEGTYYLFYNLTGSGEFFRIGLSPAGPWQGPYEITPGWAHEVWQNQEGVWFTSYLTDYSVTISRLYWDDYYLPPHPIIGYAPVRLALPMILYQH